MQQPHKKCSTNHANNYVASIEDRSAPATQRVRRRIMLIVLWPITRQDCTSHTNIVVQNNFYCFLASIEERSAQATQRVQKKPMATVIWP